MSRAAPLIELLNSSDIEHVRQGVMLALSFDDAELIDEVLDGLDLAKPTVNRTWATHVLLGQTAGWSPTLQRRADAMRVALWVVAPANAEIAALLGLRNLTTLHVGVAPPDLERAFELPKLETVRIEWMTLDDAVLSAIRRHSSIRRLTLKHVSLASIAELRGARWASLSLSSPDLEDLSPLADARVEVLSIQTPNASLSTLACLPQTRALTIGALRDWDASPDLPELVELIVTDSNRLPGLRGAPRLRRLHLAGCRFDEIDVRECRELQEVTLRATRCHVIAQPGVVVRRD